MHNKFDMLDAVEYLFAVLRLQVLEGCHES
jgi:hypothetical protein